MLGAVSARRGITRLAVAPVGLHVKVIRTLGKRCLHTSSLLTATGWVTKGVLRRRVPLTEAWRSLLLQGGSSTVTTVRSHPVSTSHETASPSPSTPQVKETPLPTPTGQDFFNMLPDFDAVLPERRIPNSVLRFSTVTYIDSSTYIPNPSKDGIDPRSFPINPANFKVTLKVFLKDLDLTDREAKRLRCLVGKRYNPGRNEMTLITSRFMDRGHNMQYLVYLLENLVAEAKGQSYIKVAADAKIAEELSSEAYAVQQN